MTHEHPFAELRRRAAADFNDRLLLANDGMKVELRLLALWSWRGRQELFARLGIQVVSS